MYLSLRGSKRVNLEMKSEYWKQSEKVGRFYFIDLTRKMELHVWGALGDLVSFTPECLAAIYYVNLVVPKGEVVVVQSSNTHLNELGQLPSLRCKDKNIGGFNNIVRYLRDSGYDLEGGLTKEGQAKDKVFTSFIDTKFTVLSYYAAYLDNENYEQVIRPLFSQLLPFPMQYNVPLNQRAIARNRCAEAGLTERQRPNTQSLQKFKKQMGVSQVQQESDEREQKQRELLEDAKDNLKAFNYIKEVLESLFEDNQNLNQGLFMIQEDTLSVCDVLLLAHLHWHLSDELKSSALRSLVNNHYPVLKEYYQKGMEKLDLHINFKQPDPEDIPSLYNKIKSVLTY